MSLAYKIMHISIFLGSQLIAPEFKHVGVFLLAGRMIGGTADLPCLQVSQVVVDMHVPKDVEELVNLRAKLAVEVSVLTFLLQQFHHCTRPFSIM